MKLHHLSFSGALLERGFWLYIWCVTHKNECVLYVGRTGDSSSKYAASPFNRLGQHLDVRPSATANMLLRNIRPLGFEPVNCGFEFTSIGPLFPEQSTLAKHRKYRDIIAPLEAALAKYLEQKGYRVIGTHPKPRTIDKNLFAKIKAMVSEKF